MRYNSKNKSEAEAGLLSDKWLGGKVVAAVKEIPSRKKEPPLEKVAAYYRVSTKHENNLTAWPLRRTTMKTKSKQIQIGSLLVFIQM